MKIFVLDPERWLRGESGNSFLVRKDDGKMCCQGQRCLMLGVEEGELIGREAIFQVKVKNYDDLGLVGSIDNAAYPPNDDRAYLSDEKRVEKINHQLELVEATYRFALPTPEHGPMTVYEVGR